MEQESTREQNCNQRQKTYEEVSDMMQDSKISTIHKPAKPEVSAQLIEYFILDADIAMGKLDAFIAKGDDYDDEDVKSFTISVHSMKNALAHIGEQVLSEYAAKLEKAGWDIDREKLRSANDFTTKLKAVVESFASKEDDNYEVTATDEDYKELGEKLLLIKIANESFNNKAAKEKINELRRIKFPIRINKLLGEMAEQLLSGNPKEVSYLADLITEITDIR